MRALFFWPAWARCCSLFFSDFQLEMKHPFVVVPSSSRARITKKYVEKRAGENLIWFSTLGLLAACAQSTETTVAEAPAPGAGSFDIVPPIDPDLKNDGTDAPKLLIDPVLPPAGDDPVVPPASDNSEEDEKDDETHQFKAKLGNVDGEVKMDSALNSLFSSEEGLDVSTIDPSTIKVISAPTGAGWNSETGTLHVPQGTSGKVVVSVFDVTTGEERLFAFDIAEPDSPDSGDDSGEGGLLPTEFLGQIFEDDDVSQEFLDSLTAEQIEAIESGTDDDAIEGFMRSLTPSQVRLLLPGEQIISEEPGEVLTMDFSALSDKSIELLLVLAFLDEAEEEFPLSPEEARDFVFDVLDTMSVNGEGFLEAVADGNLLISSQFDQMRTADLSQTTWSSLEAEDSLISDFLLEMREGFLEIDYEDNIVIYDPNGGGLPPLPPTIDPFDSLVVNEWQEGHLEAGEESETWEIDLEPGTYRIFVQEHHADGDNFSISPSFDGSRDWYNISISGEGAASKGPSLYFTTSDKTDSGYYVDIVVDSQGQYEMTVDTSTDYYNDDYYSSFYSENGMAYPEPDEAWDLPDQGYDIYIQDLGQDWRGDYTQRGAYVAHGETHHAQVDKKEVPFGFIFGGPVTTDWKPRDEGMHVFHSIYSDGAGFVGDELNDAGSTMFGFTAAENHGLSEILDQGDIVEIVIDNFSSPFGDGGSVTVFGGAVTPPTTGSITPIYTTSFSGTQSSYVFEASETGDIFVNVNASEFSSFDFSINYLLNKEDFGTFSLDAWGTFNLNAAIGEDVTGLELKGSTEGFCVDASGVLHTGFIPNGGVYELMLVGESADGVQVEYSFDLDVAPLDFSIIDPPYIILPFPEPPYMPIGPFPEPMPIDPGFMVPEPFPYMPEFKIEPEIPTDSLTINMQAGTHAKFVFALDADEEPLDTDNPFQVTPGGGGRIFETGYYDESSHSYVAHVGLDALVGVSLSTDVKIRTDSSGEFLTPVINSDDDFKFDGDAPSEFISLFANTDDKKTPYVPTIPQISVKEFTGRDEAPENYALHVLDNNGIETTYGIDDDLVFEEQSEYVLISVTTYWETW